VGRKSGVIRSVLHGEGRVVLFLLLCVLLAEGGMRIIERRLSKDVDHIRSLPDVARQMREHTGEKILFIGNSLTRCSIVPEIICEHRRKSGVTDPAVFLFYPDATNAVNWDYGIRRWFLNAGAVPDQVFIGTGPLHLADRAPGDATRLGAFYVSSDQIQRIMREDLHDWEQRCEFVLARLSILFASRQKVKPRVFGPLIPAYFDMEQWANLQRNPNARDAAPATDTFRHLDALLQRLRQSNISAHVFTIPQPKPYDLAPEAKRTIEKNGAHLHHLANIPGISKAHFKDGYHLDAEGAAIFSRALAESP